MTDEIRNLKLICSLLNKIRREGYPVYGDIDEMIAIAENIYHDKKEQVRG